MSRRPRFNLRLPIWHEWLIYLAVGALTLSGLVWLLLEKFGQVEGEFGPEPHPALPWLLLAHGVLAYLFVIASGMLFAVHIRLGWYSRRNRVSGSLMVAISIVLTVTGLSLYYATGESLRSSTSLLHWLVGLALPLALVLHLMRGKRTRPSSERV